MMTYIKKWIFPLFYLSKNAALSKMKDRRIRINHRMDK